MQRAPSWLWLVEIIRGVIALASGLLLVLAFSFTTRILLSILGIYLLIDGCLDVYSIATGRRHARRKARAYLTATASILVGLISLVLPIVTIFLLALIIAIRILIRGIRVFSDARRSRSTYVGVSLLYGGLLVLLGLVLLLLPFLTIVFLIVLVGLYALCDGLYLFAKGLRLRFTPSPFSTPASQASEDLLDLPDELPANTRRAVVFVRRSGANGLGHIGWAFEWHNGWFHAGSVENPAGKISAKPADMGFWAAHTLEPVALMRKQSHPYDAYKLFSVVLPRPKEAWRVVIWESREPYHVIRHNCDDVAYEILRTYGATSLLDPAQESIPNDWYDALPGRSYTIADYPSIPVHLHQMSQRELATREILLTIPPQITGTAPPWRVEGWRAWAELTVEWEKMLRDVRVLLFSVVKRVRKK